MRALCRVADATNEAELVRLAQEMNADQLERMCRLLRGLDDRTDADAADRTSLTTRWADDGTATIRVCLPVEDAAVVTAAVEERVKRMGLPAEVPWEARRALALVELVADGATASSTARERPLVHITVPLADLEAGRGGTVNGRPVADATVRRMLCDGSVVGVVLDEQGKPVSVGTKARVPSPRIQRAVDARDGRVCTFPGCARPSEETHHVVHWVDGRHTAVEILTSLCGYHHRAHHRGLFDIGLDPADGRVRFTRPGGGVVLGRAATHGSAGNLRSELPVVPGTRPTRWDGSPLRVSELTPPLKEHTAPTGLRFASPEPPEPTAKRLAHTLGCRFEHEAGVWVTSHPDLITLTPNGTGTLVTVELSTYPKQLTTTLTAIGLRLAPPSGPIDSPGAADND